jgi:SagB-type dehydrogenase family enzyme
VQLLQRLQGTGGKLVELMEGSASLALFITLQQLQQRGWIALSLSTEVGPLLTLEPQTAVLKIENPPVGSIQIQWSRFLRITPQQDGMLLDCPIQSASLLLQDSRLTSLLWQLAQPMDWNSVVRDLPEDIQTHSHDLLTLLLTAGVAGVVESDGVLNCDRLANQQRWTREDLSLHHRSRGGWHQQRLGAGFPGAGVDPAPPLLNPAGFLDFVTLPRPDPGEVDPGFFDVLERRYSRRTPAAAAVTLDELGRLLWASLRIRKIYPAQKGIDRSYEAASRPVAGGGAMHEIDAYLLVRRCTGLASGLYRYEPHKHQLLRIDELNTACNQLINNARQSSGAEKPPDILFNFAARYGRVSWKYEGIPYALILKHVGVIVQQLYLVATALRLAPCSLGGGNSHLFAQATQLNPYSDVPVGEFMLSGTLEEN